MNKLFLKDCQSLIQCGNSSTYFGNYFGNSGGKGVALPEIIFSKQGQPFSIPCSFEMEKNLANQINFSIFRAIIFFTKKQHLS